jgi:hypothetical protein
MEGAAANLSAPRQLSAVWGVGLAILEVAGLTLLRRCRKWKVGLPTSLARDARLFHAATYCSQSAD